MENIINKNKNKQNNRNIFRDAKLLIDPNIQIFVGFDESYFYKK